MASEWIKVRVDLHDQPEVIGIARRNGISVDTAVSKLIRVWSWADRVTADGSIQHVTRDDIDKLVLRKGFADAMVFVGWLVCNGSTVTIPNFDRHNGDSAKKRARAMNRQQKCRASSQDCHTKVVTEAQPEKRREETENKEEPPFPPILDSTAFREAWESWTTHLREKRKYVKPSQAAALLKKFAAWGPERSVSAIEHSIAGGYLGVYEPSGAANGRSGQSVGPSSRVSAAAGKYDGIAKQVHVTAPTSAGTKGDGTAGQAAQPGADSG